MFRCRRKLSQRLAKKIKKALKASFLTTVYSMTLLSLVIYPAAAMVGEWWEMLTGSSVRWEVGAGGMEE